MRGHHSEDIALLSGKAQSAISATLPYARLIEWKLKERPIAIEACATVTDSDLFARTTLEQLRTALTEPKRWVGWTISELIERLAKVGVIVALEYQGRTK
jgi:hypothetical protein